MSMALDGRSLRQVLPYIAVAGLFAMAGVGFWNNILLFPRLAQFFSIDIQQARWIQSLYSVGYFLFALPCALFNRKYGNKIGVLFALGLIAVGPFLIYPAVTQRGVMFFLVAVVFLGAGWSALETSLNPLVMDTGRRETAVWRLNFMQAFFPVGLVLGYLIGRFFYPSDMHLAFTTLVGTAARPYVVVGLAVLLFAFLIEKIEFPKKTGVNTRALADMRTELRNLCADRSVMIGATAIFCCIALQSSLQGGTYFYIVQQLPGASQSFGENMLFANLVIFGVGRFAGTGLMSRIDPVKLLLWCTVGCAALTVGASALGGLPGAVCLVATNLFLGIGYPTVFATMLQKVRPASVGIASGLLVMASGLAGLVIPIALTALIETTNARMAILMALPCFPVLYVYARRTLARIDDSQSGAALVTQV